jgi:hypothetical protein
VHRLNTTSEGEMLVDEAELPITRSQYCDALDALRAAPAHYLKEVGDQWRTPDLLFWGLTLCMARWCWTSLQTKATQNALRGTQQKTMP